MSVEVGTFLEKFKDAGIESAEIKITDSPYYYIVQKEDEKAELYRDREVEYPEEPVNTEEEGIMMPPDTFGVTQLNQSVGVFTLKKHHDKKKAELVKVLKDIDTIKEYIEFENVSEIIYEKKA